jgi:hypothetical protein
MTGTIRTLRTDKGFGFIKDAGGKDYFFHQSAVQATISERATRSTSKWARGRKALAPRTSDEHLHRADAPGGEPAGKCPETSRSESYASDDTHR